MTKWPLMAVSAAGQPVIITPELGGLQASDTTNIFCGWEAV